MESYPSISCEHLLWSSQSKLYASTSSVMTAEGRAAAGFQGCFRQKMRFAVKSLRLLVVERWCVLHAWNLYKEVGLSHCLSK